MPFLLDHVSITVTDLGRAGAFYDAVFGALGVERRCGDRTTRIRYGERGAPGRDVRVDRRGRRRTPAGRGTGRSGRRARSRSTPSTPPAWRAGGTDDGPPGLRPGYHEHYYGAFLIDPDGNRVEAVCHEG